MNQKKINSRTFTVRLMATGHNSDINVNPPFITLSMIQVDGVRTLPEGRQWDSRGGKGKMTGELMKPTKQWIDN